MKVAWVLLLSSLSLLAAAVAGINATATGAVGSVLLLAAATVAAVALEARDYDEHRSYEYFMDAPSTRRVA